ncbi:MAG: hypothetical protein IJ325_04530, partial [Clostridia bacterium]|nr:hypothetical protein [Clostridia bacterium]
MIQIERLFLRPLRAEDWQSMQRIAADFRKSQYILYDIPLPTEEQEIKVLTEMFAGTGLFFAVLLDDAMIGYVCFHEENGD